MKKISIIFLILLLGVSLRLYNLDKFSFWFDEALGVLQAKNPEAIIIQKDTAPPLYIFFLYYWNKISDSDFGLRLPSLIFGSISILMIYLLGKLLFTEKISFIGAFLLAISPFHIYYSQEARMYSLMPLLTLLSTYFLIKSLKNENPLSWLGYIIFNILNLYCHYIALFIWLAQNIFPLLVYKKSDNKLKKIWLVSNILIFLSFLPWLLLISSTIKKGLNTPLENCYWIPLWPPPVTLKSLFMTFKNFSIGYNAVRKIYLIAITIFFFFFVKGIIKIRKYKSLILCLLCLLIPILGLFFISKVKPVYVDRYFIASSLFYYLIVAVGISSLSKRWVALNLSVICILSALSLKNYYNNFLPYSYREHIGVQNRKDHRALAKYIADKFQKGDGIYHTYRITIYPFMYYSNRLDGEVKQLKDRNICLSFSKETDKLIPLEFDLFGRFADRSSDISLDNHKRIWLFFSSWYEPKEYELEVLRRVNENYKNIDYKAFDGITVYLYENERKN